MKKLASLLLVALFVAAVALLPARPAAAQFGINWTINYWPNLNWSGPPVATESTITLARDWGFERAPAWNMPNVNWSARATASTFFAAGLYRFTVLADDDVRLIVDGVSYIDTVGRGQSGKTQTVDIPLFQGSHSITVDFIQYTGAAYLFLDFQWMSGGGMPQPQPDSGPLIPMPSVSSLQTDFGDFTPCIQQNIHQRFCFVSNGAWNAPNFGSVEMEPQIVVWQRCEQESVQTRQIYQNREPQSAACSRTQAGWFPR